MIVKRFNIPIYCYKVTLIEAESKKDAERIEKLLIRETVIKEDAKEIADDIVKGKVDGGYTYRNLPKRKFIIFLFPMKSKNKRLNILGHEKRHVEDRPAEHSSISDIEAMGFLAGFLTEKLFN